MNKKKPLLLILFVLLCLSYVGFIVYSSLSTRIGNEPEIKVPQSVLSVSVKASEKDLLDGITATDKEDGDLTSKVFIESISEFNSNKERTVTYAVFDSDDHMTKATRQIKYTNYTEPKIDIKKAFVIFYYYNNMDEYKQFVKVTSSIDGDITGKTSVNLIENTDYKLYIELNVTDSCGTNVVEKFELTTLDKKPNIDIELKQYEITVPLGTTITEIAPKDNYLGDIYLDGMKNNLLKADVEVLNNYDANTPGQYEFIYRISKPNGDFGQTKLLVNVE